MRHIFYFTADWCHPCEKTRPIVEDLNRESVDVRFQIIDVDLEPNFAKNFEVRSVPTFIVMEHGREIKRVTGSQNKNQLEALMNHEF
jgi:thioredoxin-like negative regulator of GroEL